MSFSTSVGFPRFQGRGWSLLACFWLFIGPVVGLATDGPLTLSGRVTCVCDRGPVAGASVEVGGYSATADDNGFYSLSGVAPGVYTATVSATNYATLTTSLIVTGGLVVSTHDFSLANTTTVIHALFDSSITGDAQAEAITNAIVSAVQVYRTLLANPICVTILFQESSDGGLGESDTPYTTIPYSQFLADLRANSNVSANDTNALAHLPPGPGIGLDGNTLVALVPANLKALGETALVAEMFSGNGGMDCTIGLGISLMNITRANPNPNNFDLRSVVFHEVDEALGIGGSGSSLYLEGNYTPGTQPPTTGVGPLDLFRYRAPGVRSFTYNPNVSAYFSIDGGRTVLVNFNQADDGSDYGDWGDGVVPPDGNGNTPPQVQDAYGAPGVHPDLGANELIALDVAGYNLTPAGLAITGQGAATVPSPAIALTSGKVAVSWPLTAGVGLFTSPGVGPRASWTAVPPATLVTNQGTVVYSTIIVAPGLFFRLQQQ